MIREVTQFTPRKGSQVATSINEKLCTGDIAFPGEAM